MKVFDGGELVDAGVVDEDVEAAEVLDGGVDDALGFGGLGDVATDGDGLATGGGDGDDDGVRAGLAGGVVDDDGGAFGGERFGDGGSDTLGCASDDCDFTCELAHIYIPFHYSLNFRDLVSGLFRPRSLSSGE